MNTASSDYFNTTTQFSNMNNKQLFRIPSQSTLGGVAAGVANYFGMDTAVMRLIFVVSLIFSGGAAFFAYMILWAALPKGEPDLINTAMIDTVPSRGKSNGAQVAGYALLIIGSFLLFDKLFHFIHLGRYMPALILMGIGAFLIFKNDRKNQNQNTTNYGPMTFEDTKAAEPLPPVE